LFGADPKISLLGDLFFFNVTKLDKRGMGKAKFFFQNLVFPVLKKKKAKKKNFLTEIVRNPSLTTSTIWKSFGFCFSHFFGKKVILKMLEIFFLNLTKIFFINFESWKTDFLLTE